MLFEMMWEDFVRLMVLIPSFIEILMLLFMGLLLFFKAGSIMGRGLKAI